MRRTILMLTVFLGAAVSADAQTRAPSPTPLPQPQAKNCPPGVGQNAPSVGGNSNRPLGDQLADSQGVICPPAGVDPDMHVQPRQGGTIEVIPPPGSPGGDPNLHPK